MEDQFFWDLVKAIFIGNALLYCLVRLGHILRHYRDKWLSKQAAGDEKSLKEAIAEEVEKDKRRKADTRIPSSAGI